MHLYFHSKMNFFEFSEFSPPPTNEIILRIILNIEDLNVLLYLISFILPYLYIYPCPPDSKSNFLLHISTGRKFNRHFGLAIGIANLCVVPASSSNFLSHSQLPYNNLHHHSPTNPGQISRNHPSLHNFFTCNQSFRSLTGVIFKTYSEYVHLSAPPQLPLTLTHRYLSPQ